MNFRLHRSLSGCPQILLPTLWISDETPPKTVAMYGVVHNAYKISSDQPLKRVTHSNLLGRFPNNIGLH